MPAPIGSRGIRFLRWFPRSKFALMEALLDEDDVDADETASRARFDTIGRSAARVLRARLVVSALLVAGVLATAVATVARVIVAPGAVRAGIQETAEALDRVAAVTGSLSVVLLAIRLGLDRHLARLEVAATFVAMRLVRR